MKIFLGANILFSASLPESRMGVFLSKIKKHAVLCTNGYAALEAGRNLEIKFPDALRSLQAILANCEIVHSLAPIDIALEKKDIPILGGAIAGKATHLLTGDAKHFEKFFGKIMSGVKIVSPRLLAEECVRKKIL